MLVYIYNRYIIGKVSGSSWYLGWYVFPKSWIQWINGINNFLFDVKPPNSHGNAFFSHFSLRVLVFLFFISFYLEGLQTDIISLCVCYCWADLCPALALHLWLVCMNHVNPWASVLHLSSLDGGSCVARCCQVIDGGSRGQTQEESKSIYWQ